MCTDTLTNLENHPHINVKQVDTMPTIVACNFTRKAFQKGIWDDLTTHARGLFYDTTTRTIVARGYTKFFHLGEHDCGFDYDWWFNTATYPVVARKKYNGYLALIASIGGELVVFSKSGITDYSRIAYRILEGQIGVARMEQLRAFCGTHNVTVACEVIHPHDYHPVAEPGGARLVALDAIYNQETFTTMDLDEFTAAMNTYGLDVAEIVDQALEPTGLDGLLEGAADRTDEGVVIIDADGNRSKVKAWEYSQRKAARNSLRRAATGKDAHLPQHFAALETNLKDAGLWGELSTYLVKGLTGATDFDVAGLFDELDARMHGAGKRWSAGGNTTMSVWPEVAHKE